jgi:hypothetical protein
MGAPIRSVSYESSMTTVKQKQSPKAAKSSRSAKHTSGNSRASPEKPDSRSETVSGSLETRTVSARVSPAQHREIRALASVNGETIQTLLLRLLREAGVTSITEADLLDQRCGEGRAQRRPKSASAGPGVQQNSISDQVDQLLPFLGLGGAQRCAPGGLTLVINNYLRPEPTS